MTVLNTFTNALNRQEVSATEGERVNTGPGGEPMLVVGRDALVASVTRADGSHAALRVPLDARSGGDWVARYQALERLRTSSRFGERLPARIAVKRDALVTGPSEEGEHALPAVSMEWIDGPTLLEAVDRACAMRNTAIMSAIYRAFIEAINGARTAGFIHGDLAADNVMIRPTGQMVFVDLDGATWREAPFGVAGRGTPGYRHPAGNGRQPASRDEFATLVVAASLRVLAERPDLRGRFGDPPSVNGGALLFSAWDLADPSSSRLFAAVKGAVSAATGRLVSALAAACGGNPDDVSAHAGEIPLLTPYPPIQTSQRWETTWTRPQYTDVVEDVMPSVRERVTGDAPSVARPLEPGRPQRAQGPTLVDEQPRYDGNLAVWRERLQRAIDQNDDLTVSRLWPSLKDDPAVQTMAGPVAEIIADGYDRRIAQEAKRGRDDLVKRLADEARGHGVALSSESRKHARNAWERLATRQALAEALQRNEQQALADLAISGRLADLGEADRESVRRVLRALEWPHLQQAIETDDDRLILDAYDEELFSQPDALDAEARERIELARQRSAWLHYVRTSLKRRDAGQLAQAFAKPPPGAEARLSAGDRKRAFRLIERERAIAELHTAIQERDEPKIIAALGFVERVGARIGDRVEWAAVKRVVDRVSLIHDLRDAAEAEPMDYGRVAQLLPAIRALGLEGDPRLTGPLDPRRLAHELVRNAHLRRLRIAIRRDDDVAIAVAALPDPHDAYGLLMNDEKERVDRALRNRNRARPAPAPSTWPTAS